MASPRIGIIQLDSGQPPNRNNTCISGYDSQKPNYALSNFENNNGKGYWFMDPDLKRMVHFPTSEHYLHFQKLSPAGKVKHELTFTNTPSPMAVLRGIRNYPDSDQRFKLPGNQFDDARWDAVNIQVQMQINATKYQQSEGFRASIDEAIKLGRAFNDGGGAATIIEDTASLDNPNDPTRIENKWGTGPRGEGTNRLGNSQTAFANMLMQSPQFQNSLLQQNAGLPQLDQFKAATGPYYDQANSQFTNGVQIALKAVRQHCPNKTNQQDTSDMRGVINFANTSAVMAGLGVANNMQTAAAGVGGLTPQQPNGLLKYQGTKGDYQVVKRNANAAIELHIKKDGSIEGWFENNGKWQKANPPYRDNINQLINQYHTEQQQQRQQAATGLPQYPSTSRQQNQAGFNNIQNKFSNAQKATTNSDEKLHELGSKIAQHFIDRINQTDDPNKVWEINKEASNYISKYAQQQHDQHPSSKAAGIISVYFDCVARATNERLEIIAPAQQATTISDETLHELGSKIAQHFIDMINQTDDPNKVREINKEASNYITTYAQQQHDQHPSSKAAGIISAYFDCVARATNDKLEEIAANKTFKP